MLFRPFEGSRYPCHAIRTRIIKNLAKTLQFPLLMRSVAFSTGICPSRGPKRVFLQWFSTQFKRGNSGHPIAIVNYSSFNGSLFFQGEVKFSTPGMIHVEGMHRHKLRAGQVRLR